MNHESKINYSPLSLKSAMADAFQKYFETAYEIRDPAISSERANLLATTAATFAEPFIEMMPEYEISDDSIEEIFSKLGHRDYAPFIEGGLFPFENARMYRHQAEALRESLKGHPVVVTSGTGSGKTEAFLLPIVTRLLLESEKWKKRDSSENSKWWANKDASYENSRLDLVEHPAAMRAMILYPMNALVEDQLVRLRRTLHSSRVQTWLKTNRPGHKFYFGRYTGQTPLPGIKENAQADDRKTLGDILRTQNSRFSALSERISETSSEIKPPDGIEYFLPDPNGPEISLRWDMQDAPPDILITNYSMLSIALIRSDEERLFSQTKAWLESDANNVFTLVVDELHMYRGTQGTEVAYLIRRLIEKLGLSERPDQLSIIATSASLNDDAKGKEFLREFFATDRNFSFISTPPIEPDSTGNSETERIKSVIFNEMLDNGRIRPRAISQLAKAIFPERSNPVEEFDSFIAGLANEKNPALRFREHLFSELFKEFGLVATLIALK